MDPFASQVNKHFEKFDSFASHFTKVFVPKVLMEEPVSAFSAFQTTKVNKKSKKVKKTSKDKAAAVAVQNGGGHSQVGKGKSAAKKPGVKKHEEEEMQMPDKSSVKVKNAKLISSVPEKNKADKKMASKNKSGKKNNEVINRLDQPKKLSKVEQKKQQLENYLAKQLEKDEEDAEDDFDSEDQDGTQEGDSEEFSDSSEFSDEYTINESGSFDEDDSFYDSDELEAIQAAIKANRKRKSPEPALTNKKLSLVSEAKKSKRPEEPKSKARSSLPVTKSDRTTAVEERKRRKSLASVEDKGKHLRKVSITSVDVKLEPLSPPNNVNVSKISSIDEGKRAFQWLLNPISVDDFFGKYWEAKACLIKRKQSDYFSHLISFDAIDQMLIKNHVEFTKNLDVTSYKNGIRETLNPEGRALPPVVWEHYGQGCSIRLLNPQTFLPELFALNTTMQEYFHCLVGANAYLTPPNSQGFAPHYDDIEAFVMQIEGRKRWKLYKPRSSADILPRESSHNFTQQEIGKPILEEVLEPGDVLYFPRGTIHQACTEPGYHSLHITLSVYQKQSYADLFEKMLPLMLKKAIATNVEMRRGLPLNIWQNAGIAFSDSSTKERAALQKTISQLMHKCIRDMPLQDIIDGAVDQVAKKFQHEALPPEILPSEKTRTVFGSRNCTNERGECVCDYDIDERTNVRLLRANIMRLVDEEEKIRIYYYLDNSKEYCEYEPNFIEIEASEAASVEVLIKSYPAYVGVSQLPLPGDEQKINLVTALWERGLLMMEKPFK